ncbi:four helix bundle protein [Xanthomarina sp. F2636L]|uniref:four helix bundle protein n=1 Tax=Xanthomarina sp. F2636L TaxID=2996018 RepID=UPI00225E00B0|nr:four helix bundle protein [Xanthomarina sp. F2636L]MCX7549348.1 four helix bundle protein [Xanthomarina sp. F2636L]
MDHKELDVWKTAMDLVEEIYSLTSNFPSEERFGLTAQIRRAAVSIPSNIAEGAGRKGDKELVQFVSIAIGSLAELETQYLIAVRLSYIKKNEETLDLILKQKQLLLGFRNYLLSKK